LIFQLIQTDILIIESNSNFVKGQFDHFQAYLHNFIETAIIFDNNLIGLRVKHLHIDNFNLNEI